MVVSVYTHANRDATMAKSKPSVFVACIRSGAVFKVNLNMKCFVAHSSAVRSVSRGCRICKVCASSSFRRMNITQYFDMVLHGKMYRDV